MAQDCSVTLPIRSSAARAQLSDALVNRTRDRYTQRQTEQQIAQDVKTGHYVDRSRERQH